jgi:hypothetical protein
MSNNPLISKDISLKRIGKGILITLPIIIMIFVIGSYYINIIDTSLREHYVGEKVLGIEKSNFETEYASELEQITKDYGIDEYIHNWDDMIEGFNTQNTYLREPIFYISGNTAKVSQVWTLKNGYKLNLYCPPKALKDVIPGEYYLCTVKYNNVLLSDTVRYYISPVDEGKTSEAIVSLVIYSPDSYEKINDYEIAIVGSYKGGSYDDISVFKLEKGIPIKMDFLYKEENLETWTVSNPMSFTLLYNDAGDLKLVTHYKNPATGPVNVYRVWNLENNIFVLDKTIGDIQD